MTINKDGVLTQTTLAMLKGWRERTDNATPDPWAQFGRSVMVLPWHNSEAARHGTTINICYVYDSKQVSKDQATRNALFVATARDAMPRLLDFVHWINDIVADKNKEIEELKTKIDDLEKELKHGGEAEI